VAIGLGFGPQRGLDAIDALGAEPQLVGYGYLSAARADFLQRLGRTPEALASYEEALLLTENAVEREFLAGRIHELEGSVSDPLEQRRP